MPIHNMTEKIDIQKNSPPVGYNPIAAIRGAMFHEICVPFNGVPVWCYVTCLNAIQIQSCGDISCLCFDDKKIKNEKQDIIELIKVKNAQEALVKLTMVKPSFDKVMGMITESNFLISEKKAELEKIKKEIQAAEIKDKRKLQKKVEQIEYYLGFLLPDDTMSFLTAWALGVSITDIKKVSRDILLNAAIMANHFKNNATDHITGVFTDFQKTDINKHALCIYNQFLEDKRKEKKLQKQGYAWKGK